MAFLVEMNRGNLKGYSFKRGKNNQKALIDFDFWTPNRGTII